MTAIPPIKAAEWFIGQGFKVFPVWGVTQKGVCRCPLSRECSSPGKHPSVPNGFKNATDDIERVKTFLANPGTSNYGLVPPPGVICVDVDGDDGKKRWDELQHDHGPLPATLTTQTANGWHNFFRVSPERQGKKLFGFVTRTHDSGYTIGPGSTHHTGVTYGMLNGKLGISPLPERWIEEGFSRPHTSRVAITVGGSPEPETIHEGQRHDYLVAKARTLWGGGLAGEDLFKAVDSFNQRFPMPKPRADVERAIDEAGLERKFQRDPISLPADPVPVGPTVEPDEYERITGGIEYASQAQPSPDADVWLVEDLLKPKGIVVLASPEGLGKSWIRAELAIRLALGEGALFGIYKIRSTVPVLLLDEENGPDVELAREDEILAGLGRTRIELGGNYARGSFMMTDLETEEGRMELETRLTKMDPKVVIIDTGGVTVSEEFGPGFAKVMRYVRNLSESKGIVFVFVVHLVKPPTDVKYLAQAMREGRRLVEVMGHWGRHADSVWLMSETDTKGKLHWNVRKRWGESEAIIERDNGLWRSVKVVTAGITSIKQKNDIRVLDALRHGGAAKVRGAGGVEEYLDKSADGGMHFTNIHRALNRLYKGGYVEATDDGVWSLTPKGEDELVAHARQGITLVLDPVGSE